MTQPQLWVFADPDGAGKSTFVDRYVHGRIPVVNPDNVARSLGAALPLVLSRLARYKVSFIYIHLANRRNSVSCVRERALRGGHDVPMANLLRRGRTDQAGKRQESCIAG